MTKRAACCRCGKDLKRMVPDDAEEVTCFRCSEEEVLVRRMEDQIRRHPRKD